MTKPNPHARSHTRAVLLAAVALTNVLSFVVGVSASGHIAIKSSSSPVAKATRSVSPKARATAARLSTTARHTTAARQTKAARPRARTAKPLAAAAMAGARAGAAAVTRSLPIRGKGMWIYEFNKVFRGNPRDIVGAAKVYGLSHLYVRAGSSKVGLNGWRNIAAILPVAHEAGIKVIAWDFPYLFDVNADVHRAAVTLGRSVNGHRIDGFAADIETPAEGTKLSGARARAYATKLRAAAPGRFLVLVPPRPSAWIQSFYPYHLLMPHFDAVAPMVYWGRRPASADVDAAVAFLARFGKPVAPIGQAYDMGPEGGPKGLPRGSIITSFMSAAERKGAVGVSFWSWQHTNRNLRNRIAVYPWGLKAP